MNSRITQHPIWAGVVLRMPDGSMMAIELDHPDAVITTEVQHIDVTSAGDQYTQTRPGGTDVDIHIAGLARQWARGQSAAAREIGQQRAIAMGNGRDEVTRG